MLDPDNCLYCAVTQGRNAATIVERSPRHIVMEAPNPIALGHVLVFGTDHLPDLTTAPIRSGHVLEKAARYADGLGDAVVLTTVGKPQSVKHLAFHVVPRTEGDGLHEDWPWCRGALDWDAHSMPT